MSGSVLDVSQLGRFLAGSSRYDLAVNVPYALAFGLVAAEVAWLARRPGPGRRAVLTSAATATAMAAGAFVVGVAYTSVLRGLWTVLSAFGWRAAAGFWRAHPVVGVAVTFIAWDFAGWLYHLIGHRCRVGWAAHQVHHSGVSFDASLGLRQSWAPLHGLLVYPWLALAGFDVRVAVVCAAISNCWQVLEHTSVPIRFPRWFSATVMTPAAHRQHHGREGGGVNLGPCLSCWDRLAGTWVPTSAPPPAAYGPSVASSANPLAIEVAGWLELARSARPFLSRLHKQDHLGREKHERGQDERVDGPLEQAIERP